jgi:putative intracellular protease/amidase
MKILMVLTSHDKLGNTGRQTGFWLEEFAAPYFTFKDAGAEMTLASPKGGQPPLDPKATSQTSRPTLRIGSKPMQTLKGASRQRFASTASRRRTSTPSSTPAATALCGTWQRIRTRSS